MGFCPCGGLSPWAFVPLGFCLTWILSPWAFVPLGFCLPGFLSSLDFVRLDIVLWVFVHWDFVLIPYILHSGVGKGGPGGHGPNQNVVGARVCVAPHRGYFYYGARGTLPPLNFDNPKRSQIWHVACGMIIRRVAATARPLKVKALQSIFGYLLNLFWMFGEISGPLSHPVYRKVHNCVPFI